MLPLIAKLTVDMSAAPEIARLAEPAVLVPVQPAPCAHDAAISPGHAMASRPTLGMLASRLKMIAAAPERWWGLVRFDPERPVKITVVDHPSYAAWLMVLPPGDAGQACDCDVVTMIAGEATEGDAAGAALRPGPTRVHGRPHWLRGQGAGYAVSLHARGTAPGTAA
jgi:hypothetical protein